MPPEGRLSCHLRKEVKSMHLLAHPMRSLNGQVSALVRSLGAHGATLRALDCGLTDAMRDVAGIHPVETSAIPEEKLNLG